jgi:hypothetical protein
LAWAVEINKGSNLPCSFAAQLRCSLVADRCGYAPRSRLAGRQNPGGSLLPLFISTALGINLEYIRHHGKPVEQGVEKAAELGYQYVEPMVHVGRELFIQSSPAWARAR